MPIHPFLVHFTLSLTLLFAGIEILPALRTRIPEQGQRLIGAAAVLFMGLAVLTGWLSLSALRDRGISIPAAASFHRLLALSGSAFLVLLWIGDMRQSRLSPLLSRSIAIAGLLLLLGAAGMGGHLVYDDRLGTATAAPSSAAAPASLP